MSGIVPLDSLVRRRSTIDPLSQAAIGAAAAQSFQGARKIRYAFCVGALAGMAPDLDVLIRSSHDPLLFLEYHRQFTHSLFFIPVGALICALAFYPVTRRALSFRETWILSALGYATHGLLDACTTYGTLLLWPFSQERFAWHNVSVIDPLLTLPLLVLIILAAVKRQPRFAMLGLSWAVSYLLVGVLQHHRALSVSEALVAERGHAPSRLEVKPSFANVLVWKSIYEFEGHYHVDAIRVGWETRVYQGAMIEKLDLSRHFPWLSPSTQQARDVARFRWFSDDWLAIDATDPSVIVDARFSQLPQSAEGLWGIGLDQERGDHEPIAWITNRQTSAKDLTTFYALLTGGDIHTTPPQQAIESLR
jgi:inner membrane protein